MMKYFKRGISATMALAVAVTAFTAVQASGANVVQAQATAGISYPLQNAPKLTYWVGLNGNVSGRSAKLNDTWFAQGLIEKTGIEVEFIHPAAGQGTEQFNLMLASRTMTDIVEHSWVSPTAGYAAGMDTAIRNGFAYTLNSKMAE